MMTKTSTFNNMFLNELNIKTESVLGKLKELESASKKYGLEYYPLEELLRAIDLIQEFQFHLKDEDVQCCSDPNECPAGGDPGDCAPGHADESTGDIFEVLKKITDGCDLGYLTLPKYLLKEIDTHLNGV